MVLSGIAGGSMPLANASDRSEVERVMDSLSDQISIQDLLSDPQAVRLCESDGNEVYASPARSYGGILSNFRVGNEATTVHPSIGIYKFDPTNPRIAAIKMNFMLDRGPSTNVGFVPFEASPADENDSKCVASRGTAPECSKPEMAKIPDVAPLSVDEIKALTKKYCD